MHSKCVLVSFENKVSTPILHILILNWLISDPTPPQSLPTLNEPLPARSILPNANSDTYPKPPTAAPDYQRHVTATPTQASRPIPAPTTPQMATWTTTPRPTKNASQRRQPLHQRQCQPKRLLNSRAGTNTRPESNATTNHNGSLSPITQPLTANGPAHFRNLN
jgi:hypothetical protein